MPPKLAKRSCLYRGSQANKLIWEIGKSGENRGQISKFALLRHLSLNSNSCEFLNSLNSPSRRSSDLVHAYLQLVREQCNIGYFSGSHLQLL